MSHTEKSFYYQRLKSAGWEPEKHYREYTTEDLEAAVAFMVQNGQLEPQPYPGDSVIQPQPTTSGRTEAEVKPPPAAPAPARPDLGEMAGERLNTKHEEEVLRIDDAGRHWLQEEVKKPAFPKPRGRRVLRYQDPGVVEQTTRVGEYTETFEVAGDPKNAIPSEIKITLPSYQVGMYRSRKYPFKVITYGGKEGFDRQEVEAYYGGAELVPATAKRTYVQNVLCYDMRSVIRAIQEEYRQLQLTGRA